MPPNMPKSASRVAAVRLVLLLVCGCSAQLAPAYDQSVYDGLVAANKHMQALFVATGTSATKDTYPTRAAAYDRLIAELLAVELQIKARPIPNTDALDKANEVLTKLGVGGVRVDPNFSDYPSARSVADLTATIQHMQKSDQTTGLPANLLSAYKKQATIYLTQAISYENFLKR
jgi:hypothetical protein